MICSSPAVTGRLPWKPKRKDSLATSTSLLLRTSVILRKPQHKRQTSTRETERSQRRQVKQLQDSKMKTNLMSTWWWRRYLAPTQQKRSSQPRSISHQRAKRDTVWRRDTSSAPKAPPAHLSPTVRRSKPKPLLFQLFTTPASHQWEISPDIASTSPNTSKIPYEYTWRLKTQQ